MNKEKINKMIDELSIIICENKKSDHPTTDGIIALGSVFAAIIEHLSPNNPYHALIFNSHAVSIRYFLKLINTEKIGCINPQNDRNNNER